MKSVIEEGFIGVDMPPLPDDIWRGVRLLQLTEPVFTAYTASTTSETLTAWLSPVTEAVTYSDTASLYGIICANNPVNRRDPLGLCGDDGGYPGGVNTVANVGSPHLPSPTTQPPYPLSIGNPSPRPPYVAPPLRSGTEDLERLMLSQSYPPAMFTEGDMSGPAAVNQWLFETSGRMILSITVRESVLESVLSRLVLTAPQGRAVEQASYFILRTSLPRGAGY